MYYSGGARQGVLALFGNTTRKDISINTNGEERACAHARVVAGGRASGRAGVREEHARQDACVCAGRGGKVPP